MPSQYKTNVLAGAHGWNIDIDATGSWFNSVRLPSGRLERLGWGMVAYARCWVLKDRVTALVVDDSSGLRSFSFLKPVMGGAGWRSTARTLRTTQWTRAS